MADMPSKKPQAILFHKTKKSKIPQNKQDGQLLKGESKGAVQQKEFGSKQTISPRKSQRDIVEIPKQKVRLGYLTTSHLEKLAAPNAFMSLSESRVKSVNQQLSDYKSNKRGDFGDGEKTASVSASSQVSSSKGLHLLKYVRATMELLQER